jgi:iron complex transport system substrate-binding protein
MRIVSLLPSITELVCALGRQEDLVGVTHECDFPPGVESLPHLTRSWMDTDAPSSEIDELVSAQHEGLYDLDEDLLAELAPDMILTQEQCDVCAVNEETVREVAGRLERPPIVESFNPTDLESVFAMFRRVGELLDCVSEAGLLVAGFKLTVGDLTRRRKAAGADSESPPRVLLLEWLDPPFSCGHWNPEIIDRAGGVELIGRPGQPSRRLTWKQVASNQPDVVIVAPCGFNLSRAERELKKIEERPEWRALPAVKNGAVVVADGSSFFSRPGPRLQESLLIAAAAIDPRHFTELAPPVGQGWKPWRATIAP